MLTPNKTSVSLKFRATISEIHSDSSPPAVFQDLIIDGYLSTSSKSLCLNTPAGYEVLALQEIGVSDAIGLHRKKSPPLIVAGDLLHQPFNNDTLDFIVAGCSLDDSTQPANLAAEISCILKTEGYLTILTGSTGNLYSLHSLLELFPYFRKVQSRDINSLRETVLQKEEDNNILGPKGSFQGGNSVEKCPISEHKMQILRFAEPLISEEPMKPWITLKKDIKKLCEETRDRVRVLDGPVGSNDRIMLVSGKEEPEAEVSPAMVAVLRIFKRTNGISEIDGAAPANPMPPVCSFRLLVVISQTINLIGKHGSLIKSIQESSGSIVWVLTGDELPPYATAGERIVDIQGEPLKVLRALGSVVERLYQMQVNNTLIAPVLVHLCTSSGSKMARFMATLTLVYMFDGMMDEIALIGSSSEGASKHVNLDGARKMVLKHIEAFVLIFSYLHIFFTAAASSATASMTQVAEVQETRHLRCNSAEIGRFVTMLWNPSSIPRACTTFVLLQFTIPGCHHTMHHAALLHKYSATQIHRALDSDDVA